MVKKPVIMMNLLEKSSKAWDIIIDPFSLWVVYSNTLKNYGKKLYI